MELILILLALIIIFIMYIVYRQHCNKVKQKKILSYSKEWMVEKEATNDLLMMRDLYNSYQHIPKYKDSIDDITWKDLEMDAVFQKMNYTKTTMGEIYLYKMLRQPSNESILYERDNVTLVFVENEILRYRIRSELDQIGNRLHFSIYEYKNIFEDINILPSILSISGILLSLGVLFINKYISVILIIISVLINIFIYYEQRGRIERYIPFINQISTMISVSKKLSVSTGETELDKHLHGLFVDRNTLKRYKKVSQLINIRLNNKANDFDLLFEYIRCFFHLDIFAYKRFNQYIEEDMNKLVNYYETIGFVDAMMSIAYYRNHLYLNGGDSSYCKPDFIGDTISAQGIYNPLIKDCVKNSYMIDKSILITGSNATGKSTFLRTVAVNTILAQSIFTVCAMEYKAPFVHVMTSMNISDNILSHDSYFMMEIKSIKRMLDVKESGQKMLFCIDEVLRGTNTIERIGAASEILLSLSDQNMICLAASHDIELSFLLGENYNNYHFQEYVTEDGLLCDYILYKGETKTRNAIDLLRLMGYSDTIVTKARNKVNYFIEHGEWKVEAT